jgi:hypothetical protein
MDPEDPRIQTTWGNSKECFRKAAELFSPQVKVEPIEIPYEQTTLPGYFNIPIQKLELSFVNYTSLSSKDHNKFLVNLVSNINNLENYTTS